MVTQLVVASAPFFCNIAQSACGSIATKSSASSTMTSPGPLRQARGAARGRAAHEVYIFAPVDVAHAASGCGSKELPIPLGQPRRVEMTPHPARNDPA